MSRSLPIIYHPNPVPRNPDELPRYLETEFYRIRDALIAQPVAFTVTETSIIDVTTVIDWQRLFVGEEANWDVPGGSWSPINGEWECPQQGLYQVIADSRVQPFGAGNKFYYAGLALLVAKPGEALQRLETTDGGDDSVPLGVTLMLQFYMPQGTKIFFEGTVVHDQFTGTVTADSSAQILRASS